MNGITMQRFHIRKWLGKRPQYTYLLAAIGVLAMINLIYFMFIRNTELIDSQLPVQCRRSTCSNSIKSCQQMNAAHQKDPASLNKVFVTQFLSDNYYDGVMTLAYSALKHHPSVPFLILYLEEKVSQYYVERLSRAGFILEPVTLIQPVAGMEPPPHFYDQYTKLNIWNMTQYDRMVYLDADVLIVGDISALLDLPQSVPLAAVGDIWENQSDGYRDTFNAGVMSLIPCSRMFTDFMRMMSCPDIYPAVWAEQGLLNYYFRHGLVLMDYIYNLNLALLRSWGQADLRRTWDRLLPNARIIHYTLYKPFLQTKEFNIDQNWKTVYAQWKEYHDEAEAFVNQNNQDD
ncbi:hypothetical protein MIR68_006420 [Amoeboaphelidium protococcarum]|nr:hypothetical protein MIR68_006420 [Amoeboaphelidium protococcarum]